MPERLPKFIVMLACNSPDNGAMQGVCDQIQVELRCELDPLIHVEGGEWSEGFEELIGPLFEYTAAGFRIAGAEFKATQPTHWVGNWCWDAVTMTAAEVARLLTHLRNNSQWSLIEAGAEVYAAFGAQEGETANEQALFDLLRGYQRAKAAQ